MEKELDEFSMDEIIDHIESNSFWLSDERKRRLRIIGNSIKNELPWEPMTGGFHGEIEERTSLLDELKLELIFKNIDKYSYTELKDLLEKC